MYKLVADPDVSTVRAAATLQMSPFAGVCAEASPHPDLIVVLEAGIEIIKQPTPFVEQMSVFAIASCSSTEGFINIHIS